MGGGAGGRAGRRVWAWGCAVRCVCRWWAGCGWACGRAAWDLLPPIHLLPLTMDRTRCFSNASCTAFCTACLQSCTAQTMPPAPASHSTSIRLMRTPPAAAIAAAAAPVAPAMGKRRRSLCSTGASLGEPASAPSCKTHLTRMAHLFPGLPLLPASGDSCPRIRLSPPCTCRLPACRPALPLPCPACRWAKGPEVQLHVNGKPAAQCAEAAAEAEGGQNAVGSARGGSRYASQQAF